MPRVKPAIEAGFIGSAEAANAYMRQLLIRISYLPVLSPFRPVVFFHWRLPDEHNDEEAK
jgi:hypothetical protein